MVALFPAHGFEATLTRSPDAVALEIADRRWSYRELAAIAAGIARELSGRIVAVDASRSLTAYAGSLAVFAAGAGHVALTPGHPPARCAAVLGQAEVETIVVDNEALRELDVLLRAAPGIRCVVAPENEDLDALVAAHPGVRFVARGAIESNATFAAPAVEADDIAYLVFTSGSTGAPKGIAIAHANLAAYMRSFRELAAPMGDDRVATTYELTFDIALHDMFNAWWSGAALCVVPARQLVAPARYIAAQRITYWFSVASVAMLMERQGTLRPGAFPDLRVSMLCGEPLPAAAATAWAAAAPNSALYNVYGPTETTMEIAFYRWSALSPAQCRRGIAPLGVPFGGHAHLLIDTDERVVEGPGRGELLLSGPQVGRGYWKLPERTAESFVHLPGREGLWYRTGDLVERDDEGLYHFVARLDDQVKVRGHRIELAEVEAALRDAAGTSLAVVIPHPIRDANAEGLVAVVCGADARDDAALRDALALLLPEYMIPSRVVRLPELPLNANRKIDRRALAALLER